MSMNKIITAVDEQIAAAKKRWTGSRSQIAAALAPVNELEKATAELVSWAEFAIVELKDRLTASEVTIKTLTEENAALRAFKGPAHKGFVALPPYVVTPSKSGDMIVGNRVDDT